MVAKSQYQTSAALSSSRFRPRTLSSSSMDRLISSSPSSRAPPSLHHLDRARPTPPRRPPSDLKIGSWLTPHRPLRVQASFSARPEGPSPGLQNATGVPTCLPQGEVRGGAAELGGISLPKVRIFFCFLNNLQSIWTCFGQGNSGEDFF